MSGSGIKLGITISGNTTSLTKEVEKSEASLKGLKDTAAKAGQTMSDSMDQIATSTRLTWREFNKLNMGPLMRKHAALGKKAHAAAMKEMGAAWQVYKSTGVQANKSVSSAIQETVVATRKLQTASQRTASQLKTAYGVIGVRSMAQIKREINQTNAAYSRLAKSGTLSAAEQRRAYTATTAKVRALKAELRGASRATTIMSQGLRNMIAVAGSGLLLRQLTSASDQYIRSNALLKIASKNTNEFASAQSALAQIAKETRGDWSATVELYARLARSTEELGTPQKDLLTVTKALNQAIAVSGATSIEASNALVQFGQGLASGTLRGDELRSVMEQVPRVAKMITKGMGIAQKDLKRMAADGQITTEAVISALVKQSKVVAQEFAKMPPTVGQALTQINNEFTKFIGKEGEVTGASHALATGLLGVADGIKHLDDIIPPAAATLAMFALRSKSIEVAAMGSKAGIVAMDLSMGSMLKKGPAIKAFARSFAPLLAVEAGMWGINSVFDALNAKQDKIARESAARQKVQWIAMHEFNRKKAEFAKAGIDISKVNIRNTDQVRAALERLKSSEYAVSKAAKKAAVEQKVLAKALSKDLVSSINPALTAIGKLKAAMQTQAQQQAALRAKLFRSTGGGAKRYFQDQVGAVKTEIRAMLRAGINQNDVGQYMKKQLETLRKEAVKAGALYQADTIDGMARSTQTLVQTMAGALAGASTGTQKFTKLTKKATDAVNALKRRVSKILPSDQANAINANMDGIIGKLQTMGNNANITTSVATEQALADINGMEAQLQALTRPRTIEVSVVMVGSAQPQQRSQLPANPFQVRGSRATGGTIPRDGYYQLHAGERVVSNSQSFGDINITIPNGGSGNTDWRGIVRNVILPEIAAAQR